MCIHQCVDEICYNKTYGDIKDLEEIPYNGKQEEAIQSEIRKNQFLDCFEGPRKQKSYSELRSDCSRWSCGDIDKDAKMMRDQCIHECMSPSCYYQIYEDIDGTVPEYPNSKTEDEDRETRKQKFKQCFEDLYREGSIGLKPKKTKKPYSELRSECSSKTCKQIDKNDKFGRDLCLHQCVSAECYKMAYDFDVSELSYESPEEEEEDRVVRKEIFVQCVEADVPKNWEERKEGCINRGMCKDLEKNSLKREICLNECINPECFVEVYSQISGKFGELQFDQDEQKQDLQRENLKNQFIDCAERNLSESRRSRRLKPYAKRRDECAPLCTHVDKDNLIERDMCIHKCINVNCYYEHYGSFDLPDYRFQNTEIQDQKRELLKESFANCSEKGLPKEAKAKKYFRRHKTCEWKYTFQTPYMTRTEADETIYKCINSFCFFYIFHKHVDGQNFSLSYNQTSQEEKENLKNLFIDCVESGGPKLLKDYEDLRNDCINQKCNIIDKDKRLERDMCVHQCIDHDCFKLSYGDYAYRMPRYEFKKDEKIDLFIRKQKFKQCIKQKINVKDDQVNSSTEEDEASSEQDSNSQQQQEENNQTPTSEEDQIKTDL